MRSFTHKLVLLAIFLFAVVLSNAQTSSFYVASTTSTCSYKILHFVNSSTAGYTSLNWNLGNGTSIVGGSDSVSGLYTTPGPYLVTLFAVYGADTVKDTMTVVIPHNVDISYSASDTAVCPFTPVTFTNTSTSVITGPISCVWLINGDTTSVSSPTHTFTDTSGGPAYQT